MKKKVVWGTGIIIIIIFSIIFYRIGHGVQDRTGSQSGKQLITVALWDYDIVGYDRKLIESFENEYPNIQVKVISSPNIYYDNQLLTMLAGGQDIDVFYVRNLGIFNNVIVNGYAKSLNDLVKRDRVDLKGYKPFVSVDDQIYGIPYRSDFSLLYYNKDIFDEANIPYPSDYMTWENFRETGKKLTKEENGSKTYGILIEPKLRGYLNPVRPKEGFDEIDRLRPGLELFRQIQLVDHSAVDYATNKSLQVDQRYFEKGNTGMFINGSWFINYLIHDQNAGKFDFDWGITKAPYWSGERRNTVVYPTPVCINKKSLKEEAAWTFLKYISGKKGARILAKEGIIPAFTDDEIIKTFQQLNYFPEDEVYVLQNKKDVIFSMQKPTEIWDDKIVLEEVEMIMTKNKTLDEGIRDMKKRIQAIQPPS